METFRVGIGMISVPELVTSSEVGWILCSVFGWFSCSVIGCSL